MQSEEMKRGEVQRGEGGVKRYEVQREEVIRGCAERVGRGEDI